MKKNQYLSMIIGYAIGSLISLLLGLPIEVIAITLITMTVTSTLIYFLTKKGGIGDGKERDY